MNKRFYSFEKESDKKANIYIYGDIVSEQWWSETEVDPFNFKNQLESLGNVDEINVHINSYGGNTFAGFAIHNLLEAHAAKINVYVDGIAASAASIIAMAGNKIYMPKTSLMMIHNCWTYACGNAKELRKTAEDMDKIGEAIKASYLSRIKISQEELDEMLDKESLMTAEECVEKGFADEIIENNDSVQNQYSNKTLLNMFNKVRGINNNQESKQEISDEVINKIANRIVELTEAKNKTLKTDGSNNLVNKDLQEENKNSWESFFNTKK
ncbi:MAG: Clp protease ClpP [Clostridia bacterium]|nr:Clp protease ClpP [Clostridia bacterium]